MMWGQNAFRTDPFTFDEGRAIKPQLASPTIVTQRQEDVLPRSYRRRATPNFQD